MGMRHGAKPKVKLCSSKGCPNQVQKGGVCKRHGAYKRKATNKETSPHMIEQEGDEVKSVDQRTSARNNKRRRVSSAATSSTDTEEEEMAANEDEQADETQRSVRSSKRLSKLERLNYNYDDDNNEEEGIDDEEEEEEDTGDEDWGVEEQVEKGGETQSHLVEAAPSRFKTLFNRQQVEFVGSKVVNFLRNFFHSKEEDSGEDEKEEGEEEEEDDDDNERENNNEFEEEVQTQLHIIEDVEGKEPSNEELLEQIKSLKHQLRRTDGQLKRSEELRRHSEEQLRHHMVDLTEAKQTAHGGEGIGKLALQHTIKVKKEYKKRAEETDKKLKATDKKLKELAAALERIRGPKRKTRGRRGDTINPEKEKEELIRNLSTHNVRLEQSKIKGAGIGAFATTSIPKGTKLFQINGKPSDETIALAKDEIDGLPSHVRGVVKAFLLPDGNGCRDIPKNGLSFALGVSWYLNTAKGTGMEHNVEFGDEMDAFGFNTMITTRRIKEGEELLLSYDVDDTK
jgi:hypothetical protein